MANIVGGLLVTLGLDAAEYTRGLTKAEYQAKQFTSNVRGAILEVGKALGGLELGRQFLEATKDIISSAASLNDLADATGSTVESLSRLSNQAKIAGTDFGTLQSLVLKLAAGMAGADDESSKVGKAFQALGITAKDPVEALQQVAVELNKYADGTSKAAIAVALFGKQGPAFLATLKDIAELQDVGATVTAKQAAEAENLEKAFRRLGVEASAFKNIVLNDLVPALTHMIEDMRQGTTIAGGFLQAILAFGSLNPFEKPAEGIAKLRKEIEQLQEQQRSGKDLFNDTGPEIALRQKQLEFLKLKQRQEALALIDPSNNDARDFKAQQKPQLNFSGTPDAKKIKEAVSEAQRYLESLEKQLERTQELTVVEQFLRDVQMDRIKGLTPALKDQILGIAQQIDAANAAKKALQEQKQLEEEASRIRARNSESLTKQIELELKDAQTLHEQNEGIKEQIAFLRGGEEAVRALADAKLAKQIIELQEIENGRILAGQTAEQLVGIREQIAALKERQGLVGDLKLAEQFRKEAEALQQVKDMFSDAFADAFADFISGTKSAKDAFRDFVNDLTRQITRIASQNIANALFGGKNQAGPDIFGVLAKFLGIFSGAGGGGGGTSLFGGPQFATGTSFAPGGMALVGERGPELVNLPAGARVTSTNRIRDSGGPTFMQTINVLPGASRQSARQAAAEMRDATMRSIKER